MNKKFKNKIILFTIIFIVGVILDQVTKYVVKTNLELYESIPVIDGFFSITYVINTGAAWSFLSEHTWLLTIISIISCVACSYFMFSKKYAKDNIFYNLGLSLIVAGGFGNLIDRALFQGVVDFLAFIIFGYHFPTFNVADICVVSGVIGLMIWMIIEERNSKKLEKEQKGSE